MTTCTETLPVLFSGTPARASHPHVLRRSRLFAVHKRNNYTDSSRCSAHSYTFGLFEGTGSLGGCGMQPVNIVSDTLIMDRKLRFYSVCENYEKLVKSMWPSRVMRVRAR